MLDKLAKELSSPFHELLHHLLRVETLPRCISRLRREGNNTIACGRTNNPTLRPMECKHTGLRCVIGLRAKSVTHVHHKVRAYWGDPHLAAPTRAPILTSLPQVHSPSVCWWTRLACDGGPPGRKLGQVKGLTHFSLPSVSLPPLLPTHLVWPNDHAAHAHTCTHSYTHTCTRAHTRTHLYKHTV